MRGIYLWNTPEHRIKQGSPYLDRWINVTKGEEGISQRPSCGLDRSIRSSNSVNTTRVLGGLSEHVNNVNAVNRPFSQVVDEINRLVRRSLEVT